MISFKLQKVCHLIVIPGELKIMSNAEKLAEEFESGEADFDREVDSVGGSGKHRTKLEQHQHKKEHIEGDTRRIVNNAMAGEKKRSEEQKEINMKEK
ncbi:hypothetical protein T07_916 [Trichinella nelsoni]|uniref:Uncharacterized protein n=1 Tax=Trichinella nelsoni TaxID=6336 RepID=A0A0V0RJ89_9BILA|nr:hypothetical protein T07_916 [Trichinella nelsoni]